MKSLRANLILFLTSLVLCCVLYPAALWAFGQTLFPTKANGSLVSNPDGTSVGSTQIAQAFTKDEYFWPRPSAAGYNAAATGGSNWGASQPKLRDRVAQQLGPLVRYRSGQLVGPDIVAWHNAIPGQPPKEDRVIQAEYFDRWLQDPTNKDKAADIQPVPADFVMASGAGIDPHITLRNAHWQLDRVATAWAEKTKNDTAAVRQRIEIVLNTSASSPLGGLAGEPLVNVLEVNRKLESEFSPAK